MRGSAVATAHPAIPSLRRLVEKVGALPAWAVPVLLALPALALSLGVMLSGSGFNGLYGQDPYAYYGYGVGPLRHFMLEGRPLTPMFWPLGYPMLVTLSSLALGPVPAAGQVVSLLAGLAVVPLTYLLARETMTDAGMGPRPARLVGIVSALLVGITGGLVQGSVEIMPDSTALATALLSAWALVRWRGAGSGRAGMVWLMVAAGTLAWSIVTRWGQLLLLPAWLLAAVQLARGPIRRRWPEVLPALVVAATVLGLQLWLVLTVPRDPALGGLPFAGNFSLQPGQWSLEHLLQRDFHNSDGALHYALANLLYYLSAPFRLRYLSPLLAPFTLVGLGWAAVRYRRALPILVAWPAAVLLFDAGLSWQNPRFVLEALPPLAILTGLGVVALWEGVPSGSISHTWERKSRIPSRYMLVLLLPLAFLAVMLGGLRDTEKLVAARNADLQVTRWAAATIPPNAMTLSFDISSTLSHETRLRPHDLYLLSPSALARLVSVHRPIYLLVNVREMERQWASMNPGADYRLLRDGPGLIPLGKREEYALFRLRP